MRRLRLVRVLILLILFVSVATLPFSNVANAAGPTVIQKKSQACSISQMYCNVGLNGVTIGNFFVVAFVSADFGNFKERLTLSILLSANITSPTTVIQIEQNTCDHVDNSTGFCIAGGNSKNIWAGVFYGVASTAEPGMTIGVNSASCPCATGMVGYEVSGLSPQAAGDQQKNSMGFPGFYTGATFSSFSTNVPSVYGGKNDFYAGAVIGEVNAASDTATLESGYSNGDATTNFIDFPYSTVGSNIAIPTSFTVSYSGYVPSPAAVYGWAEAGVAFGVMTFGISVVPCTFDQEQCWLYPSLVLGSIGGFFFSIGSAFRVSHKAMIYLFLSGLTFGSLVAMIMGIMTVMLPLLLIVGNVFYSLRLHDRVFEAARDVGERVKERATR